MASDNPAGDSRIKKSKAEIVATLDMRLDHEISNARDEKVRVSLLPDSRLSSGEKGHLQGLSGKEQGFKQEIDYARVNLQDGEYTSANERLIDLTQGETRGIREDLRSMRDDLRREAEAFTESVEDRLLDSVRSLMNWEEKPDKAAIENNAKAIDGIIEAFTRRGMFMFGPEDGQAIGVVQETYRTITRSLISDAKRNQKYLSQGIELTEEGSFDQAIRLFAQIREDESMTSIMKEYLRNVVVDVAKLRAAQTKSPRINLRDILVRNPNSPFADRARRELLEIDYDATIRRVEEPVSYDPQTTSAHDSLQEIKKGYGQVLGRVINRGKIERAENAIAHLGNADIAGVLGALKELGEEDRSNPKIDSVIRYTLGPLRQMEEKAEAHQIIGDEIGAVRTHLQIGQDFAFSCPEVSEASLTHAYDICLASPEVINELVEDLLTEYEPGQSFGRQYEVNFLMNNLRDDMAVSRLRSEMDATTEIPLDDTTQELDLDDGEEAPIGEYEAIPEDGLPDLSPMPGGAEGTEDESDSFADEVMDQLTGRGPRGTPRSFPAPSPSQRPGAPSPFPPVTDREPDAVSPFPLATDENDKVTQEVPLPQAPRPRQKVERPRIETRAFEAPKVEPEGEQPTPQPEIKLPKTPTTGFGEKREPEGEQPTPTPQAPTPPPQGPKSPIARTERGFPAPDVDEEQRTATPLPDRLTTPGTPPITQPDEALKAEADWDDEPTVRFASTVPVGETPEGTKPVQIPSTPPIPPEAILHGAEEAYQEGYYDRARAILGRMNAPGLEQEISELESKVRLAEQKLASAAREIEAGNFRIASQHATRLIGSDSRHAQTAGERMLREAQLGQAGKCRAEGDMREALVLYNHLLEADSKDTRGTAETHKTRIEAILEHSGDCADALEEEDYGALEESATDLQSLSRTDNFAPTYVTEAEGYLREVREHKETERDTGIELQDLPGQIEAIERKIAEAEACLHRGEVEKARELASMAFYASTSVISNEELGERADGLSSSINDLISNQRRARKHLDDGEAEQAISVYERIASDYSRFRRIAGKASNNATIIDNLESQHREAEIAFNQENYSEAIGRAESLIQLAGDFSGHHKSSARSIMRRSRDEIDAGARLEDAMRFYQMMQLKEAFAIISDVSKRYSTTKREKDIQSLYARVERLRRIFEEAERRRKSKDPELTAHASPLYEKIAKEFPENPQAVATSTEYVERLSRLEALFDTATEETGSLRFDQARSDLDTLEDECREFAPAYLLRSRELRGVIRDIERGRRHEADEIEGTCRKEFREGEYDKALETHQELIESYPEALVDPEVSILDTLIRSVQNDLRESLATIEEGNLDAAARGYRSIIQSMGYHSPHAVRDAEENLRKIEAIEELLADNKKGKEEQKPRNALEAARTLCVISTDFSERYKKEGERLVAEAEVLVEKDDRTRGYYRESEKLYQAGDLQGALTPVRIITSSHRDCYILDEATALERKIEDLAQLYMGAKDNLYEGKLTEARSALASICQRYEDSELHNVAKTEVEKIDRIGELLETISNEKKAQNPKAAHKAAKALESLTEGFAEAHHRQAEGHVNFTADLIKTDKETTGFFEEATRAYVAGDIAGALSSIRVITGDYQDCYIIEESRDFEERLRDLSELQRRARTLIDVGQLNDAREPLNEIIRDHGESAAARRAQSDLRIITELERTHIIYENAIDEKAPRQANKAAEELRKVGEGFSEEYHRLGGELSEHTTHLIAYNDEAQRLYEQGEAQYKRGEVTEAAETFQRIIGEYLECYIIEAANDFGTRTEELIELRENAGRALNEGRLEDAKGLLERITEEYDDSQPVLTDAESDIGYVKQLEEHQRMIAEALGEGDLRRANTLAGELRILSAEGSNACHQDATRLEAETNAAINYNSNAVQAYRETQDLYTEGKIADAVKSIRSLVEEYPKCQIIDDVQALRERIEGLDGLQREGRLKLISGEVEDSLTALDAIVRDHNDSEAFLIARGMSERIREVNGVLTQMVLHYTQGQLNEAVEIGKAMVERARGLPYLGDEVASTLEIATTERDQRDEQARLNLEEARQAYRDEFDHEFASDLVSHLSDNEQLEPYIRDGARDLLDWVEDHVPRYEAARELLGKEAGPVEPGSRTFNGEPINKAVGILRDLGSRCEHTSPALAKYAKRTQLWIGAIEELLRKYHSTVTKLTEEDGHAKVAPYEALASDVPYKPFGNIEQILAYKTGGIKHAMRCLQIAEDLAEDAGKDRVPPIALGFYSSIIKAKTKEVNLLKRELGQNRAVRTDMEEAFELSSNGHFEEAYTRLERILAERPRASNLGEVRKDMELIESTIVQNSLEEASDLYHGFNFTEAVAVLDQVIETRPNASNIGEAQSERERYGTIHESEIQAHQHILQWEFTQARDLYANIAELVTDHPELKEVISINEKTMQDIDDSIERADIMLGVHNYEDAKDVYLELEEMAEAIPTLAAYARSNVQTMNQLIQEREEQGDALYNLAMEGVRNFKRGETETFLEDLFENFDKSTAAQRAQRVVLDIHHMFDTAKEIEENVQIDGDRKKAEELAVIGAGYRGHDEEALSIAGSKIGYVLGVISRRNALVDRAIECERKEYHLEGALEAQRALLEDLETEPVMPVFDRIANEEEYRLTVDIALRDSSAAYWGKEFRETLRILDDLCEERPEAERELEVTTLYRKSVEQINIDNALSYMNEGRLEDSINLLERVIASTTFYDIEEEAEAKLRQPWRIAELEVQGDDLQQSGDWLSEISAREAMVEEYSGTSHASRAEERLVELRETERINNVLAGAWKRYDANDFLGARSLAESIEDLHPKAEVILDSIRYQLIINVAEKHFNNDNYETASTILEEISNSGHVEVNRRLEWLKPHVNNLIELRRLAEQYREDFNFEGEQQMLDNIVTNYRGTRAAREAQKRIDDIEFGTEVTDSDIIEMVEQEGVYELVHDKSKARRTSRKVEQWIEHGRAKLEQREAKAESARQQEVKAEEDERNNTALEERTVEGAEPTVLRANISSNIRIKVDQLDSERPEADRTVYNHFSPGKRKRKLAVIDKSEEYLDSIMEDCREGYNERAHVLLERFESDFPRSQYQPFVDRLRKTIPRTNLRMEEEPAEERITFTKYVRDENGEMTDEKRTVPINDETREFLAEDDNNVIHMDFYREPGVTRPKYRENAEVYQISQPSLTASIGERIKNAG